MLVKKYFVVKINSYDGADTYLSCGSENQDFVFAVIALEDDGGAWIVDNGYRSRAEAELAWPETKTIASG